MTKKLAEETIQGTLGMGTAPDGSPVLMHKVGNHWVITEERLRETEDEAAAIDAAFMAKFTHDMAPHPAPRETDAIVLDVDKLVQSHGHTFNTLNAHLGEILGNPVDIVSGKMEVRRPKDPAILRNVDMMIRSLNSPIWNKVWELITK